MKNIRIFKYLMRLNADRMLLDGQIRLGTSGEYRNCEKDYLHLENENNSLGRLVVENKIRTTSSKELIRLVKQVFNYEGNNIFFEDIQPSINDAPSNQLVYCLTTQPCRETMLQMGYDTCIEILDVKAFANLVSYSLSVFNGIKISSVNGANCVYMEREFDYASTQLAYWLKQPKFQHEKEHRMVFFNQNRAVEAEPVVLNVIGLTKFIKDVTNELK